MLVRVVPDHGYNYGSGSTFRDNLVQRLKATRARLVALNPRFILLCNSLLFCVVHGCTAARAGDLNQLVAAGTRATIR